MPIRGEDTVGSTGDAAALDRNPEPGYTLDEGNHQFLVDRGLSLRLLKKERKQKNW